MTATTTRPSISSLSTSMHSCSAQPSSAPTPQSPNAVPATPTHVKATVAERLQRYSHGGLSTPGSAATMKRLPVRKRSSLAQLFGSPTYSKRSAECPVSRSLSLPPFAALPFDTIIDNGTSTVTAAAAAGTTTNTSGCGALQSSNRRRRYQRRGSKCPSMLLMMAAQNVRESHNQQQQHRRQQSASAFSPSMAPSPTPMDTSSEHGVVSSPAKQAEAPESSSPKTVITVNQSRTLSLLTEALNLSCDALGDEGNDEAEASQEQQS